MPADYGLYKALSVREPFEQKRKDRLAELQFLQKRSQMAEERLQKQAQSQVGIQKYLSTVSQFDVLSSSVDEIKGKERELRKPIIKKLEEYNGDARKFLVAGGGAMLEDYRNKLIMSEEVKTGLYNKSNYNRYVEDISNNRIPLKVFVKGSDGKEKQVRADKALKMLEDGDIRRFDYRGSYEIEDFNLEHFSKTPNPDDPYNSRQVTAKEMYAWAIGHTNRPEVAEDLVNRMLDTNDPTKTVLKWGSREMDSSARLMRSLLSSRDPNNINEFLIGAQNGEYNQEFNLNGEPITRKDGSVMTFKTTPTGSYQKSILEHGPIRVRTDEDGNPSDMTAYPDPQLNSALLGDQYFKGIEGDIDDYVVAFDANTKNPVLIPKDHDFKLNKDDYDFPIEERAHLVEREYIQNGRRFKVRANAIRANVQMRPGEIIAPGSSAEEVSAPDDWFGGTFAGRDVDLIIPFRVNRVSGANVSAQDKLGGDDFELNTISGANNTKQLLYQSLLHRSLQDNVSQGN